jgi:hypothetical protein
MAMPKLLYLYITTSYGECCDKKENQMAMVSREPAKQFSGAQKRDVRSADVNA